MAKAKKKRYSLQDDMRFIIKFLGHPDRDKNKLGISGSRLVKHQYADQFAYGVPVKLIEECKKLRARTRK